MATFALTHHGGDVGWYCHLVEAELRGHGHDVVAVEVQARLEGGLTGNSDP